MDLSDYYLKLDYYSGIMEKCYKNLIIDNFQIMINKVNALEEKGAVFKSREYNDAIKAIKEYDGKIKNLQDMETILKNYGKKNPKKF